MWEKYILLLSQLEKDTNKSGWETKVKGKNREMKEEFRPGGKGKR